MKKLILSSFGGITAAMLLVVPAFAHVVVRPATVGIGAYQEFTMSVPTEKDSATVGLRLMIPAVLKSVSPNVKPGWTIDIKKTGDGEDAAVTEIDWTSGNIPSGQRDDFLFQAQTPATETTLQWKAIQTYSDGSSVEWTHAPSANPEDDSAPPPYSQTKVMNDLTGGEQGKPTTQVTTSPNTAITFSLIALSISVVTFGMSRKK